MSSRTPQTLETAEELASVPADIIQAMPQEPEPEEQMPDVVGLRIPRKRVLAMLNVRVNVKDLPHRRPHVTFHADNEAEESL